MAFLHEMQLVAGPLAGGGGERSKIIDRAPDEHDGLHRQVVYKILYEIMGLPLGRRCLYPFHEPPNPTQSGNREPQRWPCRGMRFKVWWDTPPRILGPAISRNG